MVSRAKAKIEKVSFQLNTKQATESKRWIISLKKPLGGRSLGVLSILSGEIIYTA
jgi:hypothetical protein